MILHSTLPLQSRVAYSPPIWLPRADNPMKGKVYGIVHDGIATLAVSCQSRSLDVVSSGIESYLIKGRFQSMPPCTGFPCLSRHSNFPNTIRQSHCVSARLTFGPGLGTKPDLTKLIFDSVPVNKLIPTTELFGCHRNPETKFQL